MTRIGKAGFNLHGHVYRFVLGEFINLDVVHELLDLLVGQGLVQEAGYLSDLATQVLHCFELVYRVFVSVKFIVYLLHVFIP